MQDHHRIVCILEKRCGGLVETDIGEGQTIEWEGSQEDVWHPGEALHLPQAIGVYCQAIQGLKDKFRLLSLTLRPPSSIISLLPCLLPVYLSIHPVSISTPSLRILADLPFSNTPLPGCLPYSSSCVSLCYFILSQMLSSSTHPNPTAEPGAHVRLSTFRGRTLNSIMMMTVVEEWRAHLIYHPCFTEEAKMLEGSVVKRASLMDACAAHF